MFKYTTGHFKVANVREEVLEHQRWQVAVGYMHHSSFHFHVSYICSFGDCCAINCISIRKHASLHTEGMWKRQMTPASSDEMHAMTTSETVKSSFRAEILKAPHYVSRAGASPSPWHTLLVQRRERKCYATVYLCTVNLAQVFGRERRMTHGVGEPRWHGEHYSGEAGALQPAGKLRPELWKASGS